MYNFKQQLNQGESGEKILDRFFSQNYRICRATNNQQRLGIDRFFVKLPNAEGVTLRAIEYKTDNKASTTGNAFIETISVFRNNRLVKLGWAYTSKAEWLMYFLPNTGVIYHAEMARIRAYMPEWEKKFPRKDIQNHDYFTRGLLVPLKTFKHLCCIGTYEIDSQSISQ